ncbi:MAG TPA: hypothetical protein VEC16_05895 [Alphaproteobacteria bacterium]|nr:hypothetical protein [Alphaproteobacteria bacterium]
MSLGNYLSKTLALAYIATAAAISSCDAQTKERVDFKGYAIMEGGSTITSKENKGAYLYELTINGTIKGRVPISFVEKGKTIDSLIHDQQPIIVSLPSNYKTLLEEYKHLPGFTIRVSPKDLVKIGNLERKDIYKILKIKQ